MHKINCGDADLLTTKKSLQLCGFSFIQSTHITLTACGAGMLTRQFVSCPPSFLASARQNLTFDPHLPYRRQHLIIKQEVMNDGEPPKLRLLRVVDRGRTEMGAGKDF